MAEGKDTGFKELEEEITEPKVLERTTGKVEAKCEIHSEDKAEADEADKLKEGGAKEIVVQEPAPQTCKKHKQPMNLYCFDCSCLICANCTIVDHRRHNMGANVGSDPEEMEKTFKLTGIGLEPLVDL